MVNIDDPVGIKIPFDGRPPAFISENEGTLLFSSHSIHRSALSAVLVSQTQISRNTDGAATGTEAVNDAG